MNTPEEVAKSFLSELNRAQALEDVLYERLRQDELWGDQSGHADERWLVILIAGISPIPYKIFTIGSGMLGYNFIVFLLCSLISRGLRFISLTFLINKYGEKSIKLAEKHFIKLTIGLSFFVIIIFLLIF